MLVATPARIFECEDDMLRHLPVLEEGQDIRNLPTYTIPDAAHALAIDAWTLTSWYSGRDPILKISGWYGPAQSIALLSFQDVEEAYRIFLLRHKYRYSMQYLKKALVDARSKTGSDHPLLTHQILVFDYLALESRVHGSTERQMVPLGTPYDKPLYIPEVIDVWGKRIVVDSSGRGIQIHPWKFAKKDEISRPVSLNPNVMSGQLVITGTRVPVSVLDGYVKSGRKVEEVAKLYRLNPEIVRQALQHVDPKVHKIS